MCIHFFLNIYTLTTLFLLLNLVYYWEEILLKGPNEAINANKVWKSSWWCFEIPVKCLFSLLFLTIAFYKWLINLSMLGFLLPIILKIASLLLMIPIEVIKRFFHCTRYKRHSSYCTSDTLDLGDLLVTCFMSKGNI